MIWIECSGAALARGDHTVLSGLDLTVESGQLLCITGENGAGKSTLLAGLLGFLQPVAGRISHSPALEGVGYVPQLDQAKRDLPASVWEVVLSGRLARRGWHPFYSAADKAEARRQLAALDIAHLADQCFGALSGGQQRRVLLARALCAAGQLLILDEPHTGLDQAAGAQLWATLQAYCRAGGAAVVVTHDLDGARRHADRLLHLSGGTAAWHTLPEGGVSV